MASMFTDFPETTDTASTANTSQNPADGSCDQRCDMKKHLKKQANKIRKLRKKNKKLLKKIASIKEQQTAKEKATAQKSTKSKWSETIRKAIPGVISIISSIVLGIFSGKSRRSANA